MLSEGRAHSISLITRASRIGRSLSTSTQQLIEAQLEEKEITLITGRTVASILDGGVRLETQRVVDADVVLWGTGAVAPKLLDTLPLEKDDRGFLATKPTLQTLTSDAIYAVGDTGTIVGSETDKAGVYAVRQGPILWRNIQNVYEDRHMAPYLTENRSLSEKAKGSTPSGVGGSKTASIASSWTCTRTTLRCRWRRCPLKTQKKPCAA